MENQLDDLSVNHNVGNHLNEVSKWTRFIGIVAIVMLCIFLLALVFNASQVLATLSVYFRTGGRFAGMLAIMIYFVVAGLLIYFLMRFSSKTKQGIQLQNQELFNDGIIALKYYFLIYGIISVLGFVNTLYQTITTLL